jgi:hypothetical protein
VPVQHSLKAADIQQIDPGEIGAHRRGV